MKRFISIPNMLASYAAYASRLDARLHHLAFMTQRPVTELRLEYVAFCQTSAAAPARILGNAIDRAAAGLPLPWEENDDDDD